MDSMFVEKYGLCSEVSCSFVKVTIVYCNKLY